MLFISHLPFIGKKILESFFAKEERGSGLGLSITNDIIKVHGGNLNIKTTPSEGTTFPILLKSQK